MMRRIRTTRGRGGVAVALMLSCGGDDGRENEDDGSGEVGISVSASTPSSGIDPSSDPSGVDDTGDKFDVGTGNETAGNGGDCMGGGGMMGENTFSIIWIANTPEGTVSKIDTSTGNELGRYYTGPTNGTDDPSRTAVNLEGDAAVSNRGGGI